MYLNHHLHPQLLAQCPLSVLEEGRKESNIQAWPSSLSYSLFIYENVILLVCVNKISERIPDTGSSGYLENSGIQSQRKGNLLSIYPFLLLKSYHGHAYF